MKNLKLVLGSSPEGVSEITSKIEELVGKPAKEISVAYISEASSADEEDFRWLISRFYKVSKIFGGDIFLVNLFALDIEDIEKRLNKVDIIWCFGGNTDWLKAIFKKTGFEKILPKILNTKVWVGSSAGSCVLGKRTEPKIDTKIYGAEKRYEVDDYLSIINAYLYPHCWGKYSAKNTPKILIEASKNNKFPFYAMSDKSAIIVEDKKMYMIGKKAWKIEKGIVIEKI